MPVRRNDAARILDLSTPGAVMRDNVVVGPGNLVARSVAIRCGGVALTAGNAIVRFETNFQGGCLSSGDVSDD